LNVNAGICFWFIMLSVRNTFKRVVQLVTSHFTDLNKYLGRSAK